MQTTSNSIYQCITILAILFNAANLCQAATSQEERSVLTLPWKADFSTTAAKSTWEQIDYKSSRNTASGHWIFKANSVTQTVGDDVNTPSVKTMLMTRGALKPPFSIKMKFTSATAGTLGIMVGENLENGYAIGFNGKQEKAVSVAQFRRGKIIRNLKPYSNGRRYLPQKENEVEIRWGFNSILIFVNGHLSNTVTTAGDPTCNQPARIGIYCNSMHSVTVQNLTIAASEKSKFEHGNDWPEIMIPRFPLESRSNFNAVYWNFDWNSFQKYLHRPFPTLHGPTYLFPLVNKEGKTTAVGNMVARTAWYHTQFIPNPIFHMPVSADDYIEDRLLLRKGIAFTESAKLELVKAFQMDEYFTGTLVESGEDYNVTLTANNANTDRPFQKKTYQVNKSKIHLLPQKIAADIHDYFNVKLSTKQIAERNNKITDSEEDFLKLASFFADSTLNLKTTERSWSKYVDGLPASDSVRYLFLRAGRYAAAHEVRFRSLAFSHGKQRIDRLSAGLREMYTLNSLRFHDDRASLRFIQDALENNPFNHKTYWDLMEIILPYRAFYVWEKAYQQAERVPLSGSAKYFWLGKYWTHLAGYAEYEIPESLDMPPGVRRRDACLLEAKKKFEAGMKINPHDPRMPVEILKILYRLRAPVIPNPTNEIEKYFQAAVKANPQWIPAYRIKLQFLYRQQTSNEDLLAFGRKLLATNNWKNGLPLLLLEIHSEIANEGKRDANGYPTYWKRPEIFKEVLEIRRKATKAHCPVSYLQHSVFVISAALNEEWETAQDEFRAMNQCLRSEATISKTQLSQLSKRIKSKLAELRKEMRKKKFAKKKKRKRIPKKNKPKTEKPQPPPEVPEDEEF